MTFKKAKKWLLIILGCFVIIFICGELLRRVFGGFAGSYPFVESWSLYAKEENVIKAIEKLKNKNPSLRPPKDTSYRNSYWYHVNFYYADTKQTIHAWTRPGRNEFTTDLAFVSISSSDTSEEAQLINKDFWYLANKREISKFKTQIVEKLEKDLYSIK